MRVFPLIFLLVVTFLAGVASAAPPKNAKNPVKPATQAKRSGSFHAFNPAATWIQASAISDFDALYQAKSAASKGEFETTAQFEARLAASDYYAIPADIGTHYDADHQTFDILLMTSKLQASTSLSLHSYNGEPAVVVRQLRSEEGQYIGTNAFGVKVKITRVRMREDAVVMARPKGADLGATNLYVPMALEKARSAQLGFLVVFKLESAGSLGLTAKDFGVGSPTVDSPLDVRTDNRYIFAGETSIWAYDKSTGEVLQKFKIGSAPPAPLAPLYPGAQEVNRGRDASGATRATLYTPDSIAKVQQFFTAQIAGVGLSAAATPSADGKTITINASSADRKRRFSIFLIAGESKTTIGYEEVGGEEP